MNTPRKDPAKETAKADLPPTTPQEAEKERAPISRPGSIVSPTDEKTPDGVPLKGTDEDGGTFPRSTETTAETEKAAKKHPKAEKSKVNAIDDPRAISRVESMETEHPAETGQSKEGVHHGVQADAE